MDIGKALRECRKAKRVSKVALAKSSGLSVQAIYNIETNKSFPSKETISRLCKALGIPVSYLMIYSVTEEDVPQEKREAFCYLINPLKEFLSHE